MRGRLEHLVATVAFFAVLLAVACGSSGGSGTETVVDVREATDSAALVDSSGHLLYTYSKGLDCTGKCASVWHPLVADGRVVAAKDSGLNEDLLGMTKRGDGKSQVTYDGQPLYLLAGATAADKAQQFGGSWEAVRLPLDPLKREKSRGSCEPNCSY
jgi:predicted lipoprotein with Yx(FWY)xxD motif